MGELRVVNTLFIVTLNATITNRLDANGNLTNVTITASAGVGFSSPRRPPFEIPLISRPVHRSAIARRRWSYVYHQRSPRGSSHH